jgi:hypothetical protein
MDVELLGIKVEREVYPLQIIIPHALRLLKSRISFFLKREELITY